MLTREEVINLLPHDRMAEFLYNGKEIKVEGGKKLCPIALAETDELYQILSWEVDLKSWHAPPFSGPTTEWPYDQYILMQHARGISVSINEKEIESMQNK